MAMMINCCLKFYISSIVLLFFSHIVYGIHQPPMNNPHCPIWPTDNLSFFKGAPLNEYIQPTCSNNPISGTFGCVRNQGRRFHEGIDIKSIHRNRRRIPQDKIFACLPGKIAYINREPNTSSYGRYIIIEHHDQTITFYTLYAHLADIHPKLSCSQEVFQRQILGTMGNSSTSKIPIARAHLHFEVGIKLGDNTTFSQWYQDQKFPTPNHHGMWNGFNLVGLDPLAFFKSRKSFAPFLKDQPIAFSLIIATTRTPDFFRRCAPSKHYSKPTRLFGWKVHFNWVGAPISWQPIFTPLSRKITVEFLNKEQLFKWGSRHTLELNSNGKPYIGSTLKRQLFLLFGEYFSL